MQQVPMNAYTRLNNIMSHRTATYTGTISKLTNLDSLQQAALTFSQSEDAATFLVICLHN
jgi:hypothetical protein